MNLLAMLGLILAAAQPPAAPPVPYVDEGACPFECCTYRDWIAEAPFQAVAYWRPDGADRRKPVFSIAKGERVTAMSGVVVTTRAGEARITSDAVLDVYATLPAGATRESRWRRAIACSC